MSLDPKAKQILSSISTATITTILLRKGLRNVWMRTCHPLRQGFHRLVGPAFTLRFIPMREDLGTPEAWVGSLFLSGFSMLLVGSERRQPQSP
jgi:regulator of RNase E activity RraA